MDILIPSYISFCRHFFWLILEIWFTQTSNYLCEFENYSKNLLIFLDVSNNTLELQSKVDSSIFIKKVFYSFTYSSITYNWSFFFVNPWFFSILRCLPFGRIDFYNAGIWVYCRALNMFTEELKSKNKSLLSTIWHCVGYIKYRIIWFLSNIKSTKYSPY